MATVKLMQGDSYAVFVPVKVSGVPVTPDMIEDIEFTVGEVLRKTYRAGEVGYDEDLQEWYFIPTQQETFDMEPDSYEVQVRPKFRNGEYSAVKGIKAGTITIAGANSKEVL